MNIDSERQRKKKKYIQRLRNSSNLRLNQGATGVIKKLKTDKTSGTITKKRLTMKVGMFQFRKRSESLTSRVSEESKARANEDLKRIIQLANPSTSSKMGNRVIPDLNLFHAGCNSILNRTKRKKLATTKSLLSKSIEGLEEEIEFSTSPPIEKVADRLSSVVEKKIKRLYIDRDPLQESRCELRKLLSENKDSPLFFGPTQVIMSQEPEKDEFELTSSTQESMQEFKFLLLSEDEEESCDQLGAQQDNSPRANWREDSSKGKEMSQQMVAETSSSTGGCFCWNSQILEEKQLHCPPMQTNLRMPSLNTCLAGQKQLDFLDYLDKVNIRRKENSTTVPSWRSLTATTCAPIRPPALSSPSPPTYKFYRHMLY